MAKLQPPDGQDLMDGLEVKVQLGSVWKQSLTELSGGQRSVPFPFALTLCHFLTSSNLQVPYRTVAHHGVAAVQTCTDVYPG